MNLRFTFPREIVESFIGRMMEFNDPPPILLGGVAVPLELRPRGHHEAGDGGGGQGVCVRLGPEGVEDKVGQQDKVALGRGRFGAGRSKDEPAGVNRRGIGGDLQRGGG